MILFIGFELAKSSVSRIISPAAVYFSSVTLIVLLCSVGIKLWMSVFFATLGKKIDSTTLKAAAIDSRNDVIASLAVLLGCLAEQFLSWKIDGYIGLAVAVFILYSGISMAKETASPLLGQQADKKLLESISDFVCSHEKVLGIHDLLVHDYGPGRCYASVHVEISAQEDPLVCHDIIDAIECGALDKLNVHLVIHYDPVLENDAEWTQMRQLMEELIAQLDTCCSMHDFRLVRGAKQTKLVFDLAVPYCVAVDKKAIKQHIDEQLANRNLRYTTVIHFDNQE
jgi:cation diffusion facilitator family transporter